MNTKDLFCDERMAMYQERYNNIRLKFKELEQQIKKHENKFPTIQQIREVQVQVDRFVMENDLDIEVFVMEYHDGLTCIGRTFEDQLQWKSIQSGINDYEII